VNAPMDATKAEKLIEQAEDIQTQLQEFIDALRRAVGQPAVGAGGIGHPPLGDGHNP
jgi:hypothetical protein